LAKSSKQGSKQRSSRPALPPPEWLIGDTLLRGLREGILYLSGAVALYLLVALLTYHPADPGWSHLGSNSTIANSGGRAGAWFADIFLYLFGITAYLVPLLIAYGGWLLFRGRTRLLPNGNRLQQTLRGSGFLLTLVSGASLAHLHMDPTLLTLPLRAGGVLGGEFAELLANNFSLVGATLFLLALFLSGVTLFTGISWFKLLDQVGEITLQLLALLQDRLLLLRERLHDLAHWFAAGGVVEEAPIASPKRPKARPRPPRRDADETQVIDEAADEEVLDGELTTAEPKPRRRPIIALPFSIGRRDGEDRDAESAVSGSDQRPSAARQRRPTPVSQPTYTGLPSLDLLNAVRAPEHPISPEMLEEVSRLVEAKLADFNISVEVETVQPGPVITRFEIQPAPGVKVSQISNLSKDLARALMAGRVRVVEVIPGKTTMGLEIPNERREIVYFADCLNSDAYREAKSPLTLALGKDIAGNPVVADLAKMPHLLVAGTTGSGKSVAVNAMILSLLYNATPREVRLIMVDPKMLELSIYEGIPHLLAPVVTDMKDAANALAWCVAEMERRYKLMAALGVRNIAGYNRKVSEAVAAGDPLIDPHWRDDPTDPDAAPPLLDELPYLVVIVDELADLMMVVGKKIEELIARLAQKARAAGIHLILATQRPSVDVITGLIKANIPTRIAFQVSSRVDSRTILDQMGAETLLGHGDMLYLPPGQGAPKRVHGAFVDDDEVHNVVEDLKQRGQPDYIDDVLNGPSDTSDPLVSAVTSGLNGDESDPLYDEAIRVVVETRRASTSGVQRRLKVGYNRAARMIEDMERDGIVGPLQSNGSREVLAPPPPPGD